MRPGHRNAPIADRPHMPEYGLPSATEPPGLLPWEWAEQRLRDSHGYWLSTVGPRELPHLMPVWAVWLDERLWFSTARGSRKARNLESGARCVIATESSAEAVVVEGVGEWVEDRVERARLARVYVEKYGEGFPEDSAVIAVRPLRVFGFVEETFGAATRWTFGGPEE